ncbi:MAG: hypothetical protein DHS20C14_00730 [Phycisphaeraceae bacterium]|nr:MAG: hypothetical protein DHS20C14_00730 [Phycisphaeraceae bacterium]
MRTNTKVHLIASIVLLLALMSSGLLSVALAASIGRNGLAYTDRAEDADPPEVALGIAMGAFRGIFVNYLWIRATQAKEDGRYFEAIELADAITKLQPRFPRVWVFHAWNMSYNISVTTQTPEERWRWVDAGVSLLRDEGLRANPNDMLLHKELGWIFLHKIGGYTDDSNQYYKRQLAYEWQNILGAPPEFDFENRTPERRREQYTLWLRPIVDAPETLAALRTANPRAGELADAYRNRTGERLGPSFLRRVALHEALDNAGQLDFERDRTGGDRIGPITTIFNELHEDPRYADAWPDLIAHARRRTLIDDYNMDPLLMYRLTEGFGPIDWRLPGAHGLYWSFRGVREGQMEVDERNSDAFDFVNTYRIVIQSLQELWRFGDLYFNYLDVARGRSAYYQAVPNPDFLEAYGSILDEAVAGAGIFEGKKRVYRPFAAGYENLMEDAVTFYYRRGQREAAERWYEKLRNWPGANIHAVADRKERLSKPIDEFVRANIYERQDSPSLVVQEVAASLQSAYVEGLLMGDDELFRGMFNYAKDQHAYFQEIQYRTIVAGGDNARTEYLDRDFKLVAGEFFAQVILNFGPQEASLMYQHAPEDLKPYAYESLTARYGRVLEQAGDGRSLDDIFPPPPGIDAFMAERAAERERRDTQRIEGVLQK